MVSGIVHNTQSYPLLFGVRTTDNSDNLFDKVLSETTECNFLEKAPDKWVTEAGFSANAIETALNYKKNTLGLEILNPLTSLQQSRQRGLTQGIIFQK